mgnify:CR=1 FL=1
MTKAMKYSGDEVEIVGLGVVRKGDVVEVPDEMVDHLSEKHWKPARSGKKKAED